MNNLVPEKRMDKNGKLVTKHVRAESSSNKSKALPSPVIAQKPQQQPKAKKFKPRARQLEQTYRSIGLWHYPDYSSLTTEEVRNQRQYGHAYTSFEASDVEMFDVMSAVPTTGLALELMMRGIKTADEARYFLSIRGMDDLATDRSDLMNGALERGITPEQFISAYNSMEEEYRDSPCLLDGIEFKTTPLNYSFNGFLLGEIVNGRVDLEDVKTIGTSRLKSHNRAHSMTDLLIKLKAGEADYTVEDLKAFVIRAADAKTDARDFLRAARFAEQRGFELLQTKRDFDLVSDNYRHFLDPTSSFHREHEDEPLSLSYDRIEYAVRLNREIDESRIFYLDHSTQYFEAGIPYEIAAEIINGGGGLREAKAVHEDGIKNSLSGGWL